MNILTQAAQDIRRVASDMLFAGLDNSSVRMALGVAASLDGLEHGLILETLELPSHMLNEHGDALPGFEWLDKFDSSADQSSGTKFH